MRRSRNTEIYLPPSESQLMDFATNLDKIWERFTLADGLHQSLEIERRVTLAEGSVQKLELAFSFDEDDDEVFEVQLSRAKRVDDLWSTPMMKATLDNYNEHFGMSELSSLPDDDCISTEGYLEHQKKLTIIKGAGHIAASVICLYNLYNDDFEVIDAEVVFGPDIVIVEPTEEVKDLEALFGDGSPVLDLRNLEESQSVVTRADLIMFTGALVSTGFLKKGTRAYKRAPKNADKVKLIKSLDYMNEDDDEYYDEDEVEV